MWFVILLVFIFLFSLAFASASGAPWVPTWKHDLERIKALADLKPNETFIELGCGNARVARYVARSTNAKTIGVELSLLQVIVAWAQARLNHLTNFRIIFGNAFHQDLHAADVIYMFLMPEAYEKIRPKLEAELKPGSRVITYTWPIPGWEAETTDVSEGFPTIYRYCLK